MTSERVVTMEYVPGVKINNIEEIDRRAIDRKLLAKRSAEAYLTQLCRHGFFHCDPHPGDLLIVVHAMCWSGICNSATACRAVLCKVSQACGVLRGCNEY